MNLPTAIAAYHQAATDEARQHAKSAVAAVLASGDRKCRFLDVLEALGLVHRYRERYLEREPREQALTTIAQHCYPDALGRCFAPHAERPPQMTLADTEDLVTVWRQLGKAETERQIIRLLVNGERESRWSLPLVEGLLTTEFWELRRH